MTMNFSFQKEFSLSLSIVFFFLSLSFDKQTVIRVLFFFIYFASQFFIFELMDPPTIETIDVNDLISSARPIEQMDSIELETECEKLERQLEELTKQLNESMNNDLNFQTKIFFR